MSRSSILDGVKSVGYQRQADAVLTQASPTSGSKYTVLDTTLNARIEAIIAKVTWTVQPDPLEIHFTIDGQTFTGYASNPTTATDYFFSGKDKTTDASYTLSTNVQTKAFLFEGRSIKIEAEITGGTVSELKVRVKYAKR